MLKRVPVIERATAGDRATGKASALRDQAFGEFESRLASRAVGVAGPVVLFVDDLQWADRDSLALLQRALLGEVRVPCLVVATMRPGAAPYVLEFAAGAERLSLDGLSAEESRQLWDTLSSHDARPSVSDEQRDAVMREAAGHPLFLAELARSARDRPPGSARRGRAPRRPLGPRPGAAGDSIERRRFLEVVAVARRPDSRLRPLRARRRDGPRRGSHPVWGRCAPAQLVRVSRRGDERVIEPYHDRVRESILLRLQAPSLDAHRLALGRALLDGASGDLLEQRVFAIVQHLNAVRGATDDPALRARLLELNLLAAREARLATAYDRAREYARVGLELAGDAGWTAAYAATRELHVERMQAEFLAGDMDGARACFDVACVRVTSAMERTDLHASWIELLTGEGRYRDAIDAGRVALDALEAPVPSRVGMASVLVRYAATRLAQRGRPIESLLYLPALDDPRTAGG